MSKLQSISVTVDAVIFFKEEQERFLLLIKRKRDPFKNHWALPGGFIDADELVINACQRELKEETNLDLSLDQFRFLSFYDKPNRDPRSRTITFAFVAEIENRIEVKGDDDADEAKWFNIQNLPKLAFDHLKIIKDAQNA
ncbi:NUDIX domain-containing protein [Psychroflexus salinarum]|uniref:NUDIX domain-containing protein n=1 Tax=Psychroflexus salinarum TaxID=546024 RepID=A0ABW3GNB1_9FLAO